MRRLTQSLLSAAALALALPSCDNPACVFGGDCSSQGEGGALGGAPASVPSDGEIVLAEPIRFERMLPNGTNADPNTPIVLVFSEAVASANPGASFELVGDDGFTVIPITISSLHGDGRVLVLYPVVPGGGGLGLGAGFSVRLRDGQRIVDRNGQVLTPPSSGNFGSFAIASTEPSAPALVATYPADNATLVAATTEVVAVFSRPMDALTVSDASWVVTVNGVAPEFDPEPAAASLAGVQEDARVWRWRSVDDDGVARSLGTGSDVAVVLSPSGEPMRDEKGNQLPSFTLDFETSRVSAPTEAYIDYDGGRVDTIGIESLTGPADLALTVLCPDAVAGDRLSVYIYGRDPAVETSAPLVSLYRDVLMSEPYTTFVLTAADMNLLSSTSPITARVKEGTLDFAFSVRRGSDQTPVKVMDTDLDRLGRQSVTLDLTAPTLVGFGTSGTERSTFRSDQRDLCVIGRGSEAIASARVVVDALSNEANERVLGADDSGLFLAAPVRGLGPKASGLLDAPVSFELVLRDRARNPSLPVTATFEQRAVANLGTNATEEVVVEVYDAQTLAPVPNAAVRVHEHLPPGYVEIGAGGVTDISGLATVEPALFSEASILTIDANGYGLVTIDGITGARVSIGLMPNTASTPTLSGLVVSQNPATANALLTKQVRDTRQDERAASGAVAACTQSIPNQRLECAFGPLSIRGRRTGALTAFVATPATSALTFVPELFLNGYGLSLPLAAPAGGAQGGLVLSVDPLFTDPDSAPENVPFEPAAFAVTPVPGSLLTLSGAPSVRVEGLVPGLAGALPVGLGQAFSTLPNTYGVRSAATGAASPLGSYVLDGMVEEDLFVRVDAAYTSGASAYVRPRVSTAPLTTVFSEPPADSAAITLGTAVNTSAYDLQYTKPLPTAGVHKVTLLGTPGRTWTVYALDGLDKFKDPFDATVRLPLPLVGPEGTLPLGFVDGGYTAVFESVSWETYNPRDLSFADLEREPTAGVRSRNLALTLRVP